MLNQLEVFNSVEVLAPGIELDDLDSMLNSGEFSHWHRFISYLYFRCVWKQVHVCTALSCYTVEHNIPHILESNPHPFYSFRGLKNQMWITVACGLDLRSRAGFWKNYGSVVRAIRTIQHNNLLFYLLLIIIYYSSDLPLSFITESLSMLRRDCTRLLRKTCFTVPV